MITSLQELRGILFSPRAIKTPPIGISTASTAVSGGDAGLSIYPLLIVQFAALAIVANLLYVAGPLAELYLRVLGVWHRSFRWILFSAGTAVAFLLALVATYALTIEVRFE